MGGLADTYSQIILVISRTHIRCNYVQESPDISDGHYVLGGESPGLICQMVLLRIGYSLFQLPRSRNRRGTDQAVQPWTCQLRLRDSEAYYAPHTITERTMERRCGVYNI
jgi:hypothetical protein